MACAKIICLILGGFMRSFRSILFILAVILSLSTLSFAAAAAGDFYNYGLKVYDTQNYKKAMTYFIQAAKMNKSNPEYFRMIGNCLEKTGDTVNAKKYFAFADRLEKKSAAAGPAKTASRFKVTGFAGFTTVAMTKQNAEIDKQYANGETIKAVIPDTTNTKNDFGGAFMAGADFGYYVIPNLSIGARLEYIGAMTAKTILKYSYTDYDYWGNPYQVDNDESTEMNASIVPILVGASYDYALPGAPIIFGGELFLGYGFAGFSFKNTSTGATSEPYNLAGSAFVLEINSKASFNITPAFAVGAKLGYRLANVGQMKTTKAYGLTPAGTVYTDGSYTGNGTAPVVPFDFSGLIFGLSGTYSF
jgi:hypothetical protein